MVMSYEVEAKLAKKCPFCGCERIKTKQPEWVRIHDIKAVSIKCDNCGAEVTAYTVECDFYAGYRKALKLWNRRAS